MTTDRHQAVSDLSEAGAPEIEITPAMIEAGVTALYDSGSIENPLALADRNLVRAVFLAMLSAR